MAKSLLIGTALALMAATSALSQTNSPPPPAAANDGGHDTAGARAGNITATGETVPNPGASQSAGTTDLDRGIQREDAKIQSSICKGC